MTDRSGRKQSNLRIWAAISVPSQHKERWLKPQARLSNLLHDESESVNQAARMVGQGKDRTAEGSHGSESGVANGFYARPVAIWQEVLVVQRDR